MDLKLLREKTIQMIQKLYGWYSGNSQERPPLRIVLIVKWSFMRGKINMTCEDCGSNIKWFVSFGRHLHHQCKGIPLYSKERRKQLHFFINGFMSIFLYICQENFTAWPPLLSLPNGANGATDNHEQIATGASGDHVTKKFSRTRNVTSW